MLSTTNCCESRCYLPSLRHVSARSQALAHRLKVLCCCSALLFVLNALPLQELTKSMGTFGYDILQALVNDIAPDARVSVLHGKERLLCAVCPCACCLPVAGRYSGTAYSPVHVTRKHLVEEAFMVVAVSDTAVTLIDCRT